MMVAPSNEICETSFVTTMGTQSRLDSMQKVIIYNGLEIDLANTEHYVNKGILDANETDWRRIEQC